jgi:thiamine pyrophosphate-dependent acetolactate synthase large subunit-like protein
MLGLLAGENHTTDAVRGFISKTTMPVGCTYQGVGVVRREHFHRFWGTSWIILNAAGRQNPRRSRFGDYRRL